MKHSRTFLIETTIDKIASDEATRAQLRRFFAGSQRKPLGFFEHVARVAEEIQVQLDRTADGGGVHIVALDGSGRVSLAHAVLATQRICEGTHRLAAKEDLERLRAEKAVLR